ncbi:MAG: type II toxin-antitoxin system RelE/ParE family toxin [Sphingobacteriales bacterium JAD_PAG50586_3]|nr:MAG: type II toxin-antitoxin system RelE/ParE family toxin [Sphingobacteriales bacterium JAD_PAG50586_3]
MVKIEITPQALSDIDNIADYIAKDSIHYAEVQVQRIYATIDYLFENIQIGRVVPEVNRKYLRELILGNYRIIYKVVSKTEVHILTVYHSKRKLRAKDFVGKTKVY